MDGYSRKPSYWGRKEWGRHDGVEGSWVREEKRMSEKVVGDRVYIVKWGARLWLEGNLKDYYAGCLVWISKMKRLFNAHKSSDFHIVSYDLDRLKYTPNCRTGGRLHRRSVLPPQSNHLRSNDRAKGTCMSDFHGPKPSNFWAWPLLRVYDPLVAQPKSHRPFSCC